MKLIAIEPVKVGGKRREPGAEFEADDTVGSALIKSGAAELVTGKAKAKVKTEAEAEGDPQP